MGDVHLPPTDCERPAADRRRDPLHKPYEVLAFFGIRPGMTVLELQAGRGYYAEVLARLVAPMGRVYAQNSRFVREYFADAAMDARLADHPLPNLERLDVECDALGLAAASLDAAVMILFYHDMYWQGVDRSALAAGVLRALKPGGVFGLVDHRAPPGSGDAHVRTLHRVDEAMVRAELEAAGFVLAAESDLLTNPADDRTVSAFDESIRGRTDRFVWRLRKPR